MLPKSVGEFWKSVRRQVIFFKAITFIQDGKQFWRVHFPRQWKKTNPTVTFVFQEHSANVITSLEDSDFRLPAHGLTQGWVPPTLHDIHWQNHNDDSKSELTSHGSNKTGKEGRSIPRARTIQWASFYSFHGSPWLCCYTLIPSIVQLSWPHATISQHVKLRQIIAIVSWYLILEVTFQFLLIF